MSDITNLPPVTGSNFTAGNSSQLSTGNGVFVNPPAPPSAIFPQAHALPGGLPVSTQVVMPLAEGGFNPLQTPGPVADPAPLINNYETPAIEGEKEPVFVSMPDDYGPTCCSGPVVTTDVRGVEATLVESGNAVGNAVENDGDLGASDNQVSVIPTHSVGGIDAALWKMADELRYSSFLPMALRSVGDANAQKTADVYIILQKARNYGFDPVEAFDRFFVITGKDGFSKLGMYVQSKAAVCARHGTWKISLDGQQAVATVVGHRYGGERTQVEVTYTGYDAALKGFMRKSPRTGCWEGVGKWADKWPDMLKTRALGRFLDQVFPDLVGGLASNADDYETVEVPRESASAIAIKEHLATQTKSLN